MAYNVAMPAQIETLFREYAPRVLDYARHRGATLAEAEDVVSEVFIVLTRRLDHAPDDVLPWLYGVARKVLANHSRSKRRRLALTQRIEQEVSWLHPDGQEASSAGTSDPLIGQALSMLSPKDREVLLLVAWDDLSYGEAARSLGCTSAAFAQMLRRARLRMMHNLDQIRAYDMPNLALGESRE
jgi:RNA polymerase sigma-70 factor (ECF subfamily)